MFIDVMNVISKYTIPIIVMGIVGYGQFKKVKLYETFTEGAKEGFKTAVMIIPFLVAMLVGIGVFRASGGMDLIVKLLNPITSIFKIPGEVLPLSGMRLLSGGGARGAFADMLTTYGADSLLGRMSAVIMGSTQTTFYIIAVYFGSIGIKDTRHALPSALIGDFFGVITAIYVSLIFFG